jgi:hypothetical protein
MPAALLPNATMVYSKPMSAYFGRLGIGRPCYALESPVAVHVIPSGGRARRTTERLGRGNGPLGIASAQYAIKGKMPVRLEPDMHCTTV